MSAGRRLPSRARGLGLAAALAFGAPAAGLFAAPAARDGIAVRDPWVRWLPAGLPAAGYLTLVNATGSDRFLTGVSSADYGSVMLHQSYSLPDGSEGMRAVARLRIPAHGQAVLAPGGYHLMLMRPLHPIAPGGRASIELRLDDGTTLRVLMPVEPPGQGK